MVRVRRVLPLYIIILILAFTVGWLAAGRVHAQTTGTALQLTGSAPHTTCVAATGVTTYCLANDGFWQSINGAPYVQLTPGAVGGVTSVNGKTGAVVISATSTTTLQ